MNRECILPNTCKDIPVTFVTETIHDANDSEFPPINGAYFNTIVKYATTGHVYLYDSDGVPSLLNDISMSIDDKLSTISKNPVQNKVITQALEQASSETASEIAELKTNLASEAQSRAEADTALSEQISSTEQKLNDEIANSINSVETSIATGLAGKVDKVEGKSLSTNDFTNEYQEKLAGIEAGAQVNPTKVSAFANDAGYITGADVEATVDDAVNSAVGDIDTQLDKNVVQNIRIDDSTSADVVSLVSNSVNLSSGETSSTDVPLPVASADNAGMVNPATFNSIQDSAEKVDVILNGSVAIDGLPAEPTQEQLSEAWKTATSKTEIINGAKIYDQANNKTWTYYTNVTTWYGIKNSGADTVAQFTNEAAGIIKGSTTDGQVFAEPDGTGSVNGWDALKSQVNNLEENPYTLPVAGPGTLGGVKITQPNGLWKGFLGGAGILLARGYHELRFQAYNAEGVMQPLITLRIPAAVSGSNNAGLLSPADKAKLDNMPEFEVVTSTNDPGEGSELAANKVIFVVEG